MNILLWILQIGLAFWNITGATYMMSNYQGLANNWALSTLPAPAWTAIGVLQILFSIGLIVPKKWAKVHNLRSYSAAGLGIIALLGTGLYVAYAGFPGMLWGFIPTALAFFVAYMRMEKK